MAGEPGARARGGQAGARGPGRFVLLVILAAVLYLAYWLLFSG